MAHWYIDGRINCKVNERQSKKPNNIYLIQADSIENLFQCIIYVYILGLPIWIEEVFYGGIYFYF